MKKLLLLSLIVLAVCSSCKDDKYPKVFLQVGGDKEFDRITFLNDSLLSFKSPDNRVLTVPYTRTDKSIAVYVAPMVTSTLQQIDNETLVGSVPFFEGQWKRQGDE